MFRQRHCHVDDLIFFAAMLEIRARAATRAVLL